MKAIARPRSSWNPEPPRSNPTRVVWGAHTQIRVHHSVTRRPRGRGKALKRDELQVCRELQQIALRRWFSDVSYNLAIMPSGRRYWLRGPEILGAHTLGDNDDFGVVFVGNYETTKPTIASLVSFWQMRRLARKRWGIDAVSLPHSATYPTTCPGRYLKRALKLE